MQTMGAQSLPVFFYYVSMPNHTFSGVSRVRWRECRPFKMMNKPLDVSIRIWMEDVFVKRQFRTAPPELVELFDGKAAEMIEPSALRPGVEDV